ncbi:hypothetical protein N7462_003743 [Penicillium macrosclerotiorum]|uniref:uncharacterized protein n=1 Tax=Penicillium macrosclerotiorum TaxID=303699 RepID=UPI002546619B|nr:uncharacterized protein N7462_003743 [Penicillium macrosclerotiorum]KAJ5689351.1 hypothetical protein N7462_003743 [Penicillium macrosclerotiorum]
MDLTIPENYRDKLEHIETKDCREDAEILAALQEHRPVTSEKNVWAYWHAGLQNMPKWCQRNVIDWVRILGPDWTIRVLDSVAGSVNNVLRFVPEDLLPPAFVDQTMDGPFARQHSSDFARTACLYNHGGVWIDVGIMLSRHLDRICWRELEDSSSPYQVAISMMWGMCAINFFIASRKGNPFIYQWHRLFLHIWGDKKNAKGSISNPLIAPILPQMWEGKLEGWKMDWGDNVAMLEYVMQIGCFTRLLCLEDVGEGLSGIDYWRNHIMGIDTVQEVWRKEYEIGFADFSERAFEMLQLPVSGPGADPTAQIYKDAERFVWDTLANQSMWKLFRAAGMDHHKTLAALLDIPENDAKVTAPNTFGALLRYGTVHLRQTRENIGMVPKVEPIQTWNKGVFEP